MNAKNCLVIVDEFAWLTRLTILACTFLAGCSEVGPKRVPIRGTVMLDDKPVVNATIIFTPTGQGLAAAAMIEDGQFSMTKDEGPTIGEFDVRINPMEAELEQPNPAGLTQAHRRPKIPKVYQRDGKLQASITDQFDQRFDFQLRASEK